MEKHLFWYKYHSVNRYLFDLLVNQEFWFSKPKDFNDPFDCNIDLHIKDDEDLLSYLRKINQILKSLWIQAKVIFKNIKNGS